jgi:hypothetical protein
MDSMATFLANELDRTATALAPYRSEPKAGTRPLSELQRWSDVVLTHTPSTSGVLSLYLISRLMDDILDNLTGDFFYDEASHELRQNFLLGLIDSLEVLARRDLADPADWAGPAEEIVRNYLKVIADLELHIEDKVPSTEEKHTNA